MVSRQLELSRNLMYVDQSTLNLLVSALGDRFRAYQDRYCGDGEWAIDGYDEPVVITTELIHQLSQHFAVTITRTQFIVDLYYHPR